VRGRGTERLAGRLLCHCGGGAVLFSGSICPACGEVVQKALGLTGRPERGTTDKGSDDQTKPKAKQTARNGMRTPNQTEQTYRDTVLRYRDARYEAMTFKMSNGHKYTPDWVVFEAGRPIECHECKGAYRLGSYQRARLAFDQARVEFSGLKWVWGEEG